MESKLWFRGGFGFEAYYFPALITTYRNEQWEDLPWHIHLHRLLDDRRMEDQFWESQQI